MPVSKEDIAASFRTQLERFGYRKTSVEDVARDLHISKKTIYVHFGSKEEMFRHVVRQMAEEEKARIAAQLADRDTCWEKIEGLVGLIFRVTREWWRENRESEFVERYEIGERVFLEAYSELIAEWVRSGVERGEFDVESTKLTVVFIGGIILAGTRLLRDDAEASPEAAVIDAIRKLLT